VLGDAAFADAILDRRINNAYRITCEGTLHAEEEGPTLIRRGRTLTTPASLRSDWTE
jgi:hypothetical protein